METNLYLGRQKEQPTDGAFQRWKGVRGLSKSIQAEHEDILGDSPGRHARLQAVASTFRERGILMLGCRHNGEADVGGGVRLYRSYTASITLQS